MVPLLVNLNLYEYQYRILNIIDKTAKLGFFKLNLYKLFFRYVSIKVGDKVYIFVI